LFDTSQANAIFLSTSTLTNNMKRNRYLYLLFIALTIAAGLASRYFANQLPCWVNLYLGDTLWALMVFFLFGFIFKRRSTLEITLLALVFSCCIEISQLYHTPWIDAIRATRLGGLILGFGFFWSDLLCYSVGVGIGLCIEKYHLKSFKLLR
jgi:hypothetical protein